MMKKLICLFIAVAMMLPLASCVPSSPEGTAEPTDAAPTETDPLAYNPETDADNRYLNAPCCITELDNAFIWHDRRQGLFYYNDKETGENGVLCNKPECQHDSGDCGGAPSAEPVVWYYEGKLYWRSEEHTSNSSHLTKSRMPSSA